MTQSEFDQLRYGNVIRHADGRKFAVTLVLRDKEEKPVHVALTRAIDAQDAQDYEVVSKDRLISFITGQTIQEAPIIAAKKG